MPRCPVCNSSVPSYHLFKTKDGATSCIMCEDSVTQLNKPEWLGGVLVSSNGLEVVARGPGVDVTIAPDWDSMRDWARRKRLSTGKEGRTDAVGVQHLREET